MAEKKELTKEEIKELLGKLDVALKKSDDLVNDFKVYIGVYRSNTRSQTSHITKEEYDIMGDRFKNFDIPSVKRFYDTLTDQDVFVTKSAVVLDKDNFAMAFHPMIWQVLTFEERVAAMRVAWSAVHKNDIKDFTNNYTSTVVFVGNDYKGSLNIGSMLADHPWVLLKSICDAENALKFNKYFNKQMSKSYDYITDFDSFEEMQYLSPLEPKQQDIDQMTDHEKAIHYNQIYSRKMRENYRNADYLILDHSEPLKGLDTKFDEALDQDLDDINRTDTIVTKELGYFQKDIDEDYLKIKVTLFNNENIKKHNELCDTYYALEDKIKEIKKPALEKTKDLRAKKSKLEENLKNAGDAIEISIIEDELLEVNKKINKINEQVLGKYKKELKELTDKKSKVYSEIQELKSHIIEIEDAKEHFKEHFYPTNKKTYDDYKATDVTKPNSNSILTKEEYEKMN